MDEQTGIDVSADFDTIQPEEIATKIWYESSGRGGCYWVLGEHGNWVSKTEQQLRRWLKNEGVRGVLNPQEKSELVSLTPLDKVLLQVETERVVVWSGIVAGRKAGPYIMGGQHILVTHSPTLIEPLAAAEDDPGIADVLPGGFAYSRDHDDLLGECRGWPYLGLFWRNLLACLRAGRATVGGYGYDEDFDQRMHFLGWVQRGVKALYDGSPLRGHIILLAGEPGCGKSLTIDLLAAIFGGRVGRPLQWIEGGTSFNEDLYEACLLVVDDEGSKTRIGDRKTLSAKAKQVAAVRGGRMEGKGKKGLELEPLRRLVFATNLEEQNLLVFPPIDDDIRGKVMLYKCYRAEFPWGEDMAEEKTWSILRAELPHFIHWLLNEFELPAEFYEQRFGVQEWLHPEIREKIEFLSPEVRLMGYINRTVLKATNQFDGVTLPIGCWKGNASDLEDDLKDPENKLSYKDREHVPTADPTIGKYLKTLSEMRAYKGLITYHRTAKKRYWTIMTRECADNLADSNSPVDDSESLI